MQHIGRNILSMVVSRVLSGVILFLIYSRLVQYLGPEAAGHFGLLASYLTVFSFFVDLGMSQLVIKKMSEDASHMGKYLTNYFVVQLGLGVAFMAIMDMVVFLSDYPQHVKSALYVAGLGLLLSSLNLPFKAVVVAKQKLTIHAQVNFYNSFINAGMMALAIILRQNVLFLAFISVAVSVFDLSVYSSIVHRRFAKFTLDIDWQFIKQLFIWNLPFMALTLFSVYNRVDGLMLPYFRSFVETGYYAAAYKFWDMLAFFPGVIGISLYPFFAQAVSLNLMEDVRRGLEIYTRYMIAVAVPMALGTFLLADQITVQFFGQDFLPAAPALWLLVLAAAILFIYTPANSLIISQLTKVATKVTGVTFLFNIVGNLILIPRYGFVAAAVTTVISELIQTVGYSYFIKKRVIAYSFLSHFAKPVLAAAVMGLFVYFFKSHNLWVVIMIAGVIYATGLFVLKFFRPTDWDLFKSALNLRKTLTPEKDPLK
jgi:O-antigen/teichoic acid export membrane protein